MRPAQRSSIIRRAFIGGSSLAVLASLGGGASAADPSDEAQTVSLVAPAAAGQAGTGAGAGGIRSVDFGDVAQPGSACTDGLRFTPPGVVPVSGGASRVLDLATLTQLSVDPEVSYGDVDGDGDEDAVVHVTCSYGANGSTDSLHVWSLEGDRLVHVAGLDEPADAQTTGGLPPAVQGVAVTDEGVTVTWSHYAPGDPNCCASQQARLSYALDGNALEPVGEPVVTAARP